MTEYQYEEYEVMTGSEEEWKIYASAYDAM